MKATILLITIVATSINLHAKKDSEAHHQSIYTKKIQRIVKAINIGDHASEKSYLSMLKTACQRNQCNGVEKETIQLVGKQIVNCQINHLKSHNVENSDASNICASKQVMIGCDSLATSLLRKMCYTGNHYSLKTWYQKEKRINKRQPASVK